MRKIIYCVTKTLVLLALSKKNVVIFFKFLMNRCPLGKYVQQGDDSLLKARIARHSTKSVASSLTCVANG